VTGPSPLNDIFILIPAYRDEQLVPTVRDCLAKARDPGALRFGICVQEDLSTFVNPFEGDDRIRVDLVDYRESRGAGWARHRAQQLYRGERYVLYLDAHMRFVEHWDTLAIEMLDALPCAKPILTCFPPMFEPRPDGDTILSDVPNTIQFAGMFNDWALPLFHPVALEHYREVTSPIPGRSVAAGFMFTHGRVIAEVPIDPEIYFLGEEVTFALRAFTHGYDFFYPHRTILFHYYARPKGHHWEDHEAGVERPWFALEEVSRVRVRKLLGIAHNGIDLRPYGWGEERPADGYDVDLGPYGLGTVRSRAEFEAFTGLDLEASAVEQYTRDYHVPPNPAHAGHAWPRFQLQDVLVRITPDPAAIQPAERHLEWKVFIADPLGVWRVFAVIDAAQIAEILREPDLSFVMRYRTVERGGKWTIRMKLADKGWQTDITGDLPAVADTPIRAPRIPRSA